MAHRNIDVCTCKETDWTKCCLCQEVTVEELRHPYRKKQYHDGYITLGKNLLDFHGIKYVPLGIDIRRLDDGTGIAYTLLAKQAKYHKSCKCECS